ncbi:MAG: glucose-1-phosphate thymidylyltransferase, partial [Flavobacteriaceae bacterium]|nr:glucose-1-phosphate thymidylyltransferase [Flavobacteriaceae bacterium]
MNYILFDGPYRDNLLPFTYTRPVADIRVGILTIRQKWESFIEYTTTTVTEDYLSDKFPMVEMEENIMINASFLPNTEVVELIKNLSDNQALFKGEDVIAFFAKEGEEVSDFSNFEAIEFEGDILKIEHTWDIFSKNGEAIEEDFNLITNGRKSEPIPATVKTLNPENIFIEKGAKLNFVTLNASSGPIYIGRDAEIME